MKTSAARRGGWRIRTNYLPYPRFQLSLVLIQTLILAATQSALWIQVERALAGMMERGQRIGFPPDHVYFTFVREQTELFRAHLVWGTIVAWVLSTLAAVTLSHRLAGPIVRLRTYFQQIAKRPGKDLEPIAFREGDFFADMPHAVNEALRAVGVVRAEKAQQEAQKDADARAGSRVDRGAA